MRRMDAKLLLIYEECHFWHLIITRQRRSHKRMEYVFEFMKLKDLIFRFGPKTFLNYIKDLQFSHRKKDLRSLSLLQN